MGVCVCSLAGTKACETCPNNGNDIRYTPISWPQDVQVYGDDAYQRGLSEGRKQGLKEAVEIVNSTMIIGDPIDSMGTGWNACGRTCVKKLEAAIEKEGK